MSALKHVRLFPNSLQSGKVPISKTICSSPTGGTRELGLKRGGPLERWPPDDSSSSEYLSHKPGDFYLNHWLFHTWYLPLQSWKHPEAPLWDRGPIAPAVAYLLRLRGPWEEELALPEFPSQSCRSAPPTHPVVVTKAQHSWEAASLLCLGK